MTRPAHPRLDPPEDEDLERLRDVVATGRYRIPAIDVADAIISFHREGRRTDDPPTEKEG